MTGSLLLKSSTLPFLSLLSVDDFYFPEEMENQQRTSTTASATNWHLCPHTHFRSYCMKAPCVLQSQRPHSPTNELGSVLFCLFKSTTAAILRLSLLYHQFLPPYWIIPSAHKHDVISPILKQEQKNPAPPRSSASYFSTSLNSKTTLKNYLYLLSPITLLFLLNPLHDAKSNGHSFIFCSIWQLIIF